MPEYLAPGVYVEEVSFRSKSIEGVSTTTTGFIGPTRWGPIIEDPQMITSLGDFECVYGDGSQLDLGGAISRNFLWHAARAFFAEGGRRLYVSRIFRGLDENNRYPPNRFAEADRSSSDPRYADGHARASIGASWEVQVRGRYPGAMGNLQVEFSIRTGQNILGCIPDPADRARQKPVLGALAENDVVWTSAASGTSGAAADIGQFYSARRHTVTHEWEFHSAVANLAATPLTIDQLFPNPHPDAGDTVRVVTAGITARSANGRNVFGVWNDLPLDPAHQTAGVPDALTSRFGKQVARGAVVNIPITVTLTQDAIDGLQLLNILFPASDRVAKLTLSSQEIAKHITVGDKLNRGIVVGTVLLKGGNDGKRPGAGEYEGKVDPARNCSTGLKQFEAIDEISIVAAPGLTWGYTDFRDDADAVNSLLIAHSENMRYRISILDSAEGQTIADVRKMRARLDSSRAALYYPWVTVLDPVTRTPINLPPSGFVAGIYARNDFGRGVCKAPANEVVNLAIGFETLLNKSEQDVLNPEGVNCFRYFEGRGYRLWGARTISSDPEWKYINIRRYFAYLEHSIDKGTQWAVFEPNNEALWANVRRTIEDFLFTEWQNGALPGEKPEKSFFVKCDRSTMTQNDLDNGRLVCMIGVAPAEPAEFVIFRIGQWTADRIA